MKILKHFFLQSPKPALYILFLCFCVAFGRILILNATNSAMKYLIGGETPPMSEFGVAVAGILLLLFVQPIFYQKSVHLLEGFILNYRLRVGEKIRQTTLHSIEKIDEYGIFGSIVHKPGKISESAFVLILFTQSVFEWILIMFYVAIFISTGSAGGVFVMAIAMVALVEFSNLEGNELQNKITDLNARYSQSIGDLVLGFKELKVDYKKQQDLQKTQGGYLKELQYLIPKYMGNMYNISEYSKVLSYGLLGLLVFVFPLLLDWSVKLSAQLALSILFITLPLVRIGAHWSTLPLLDMGFESMLSMEKALGQPSSGTAQQMGEKGPLLVFNDKLVLKDITFTHTNKDGSAGYILGPINMELTKGETLFIVGGNGSGKSTFLKVLTGLYKLTAGEILLDGQKITSGDAEQYRELFVAIFTDFYLPDTLLGVEAVNIKKARHLIKLFGLKGKTDIKGDAFTTTSLSTGQRKRLAMIVAFLENKSIYIFDEVAADQDPDHRRLFYQFILPDMKKAGKTCIVVSHDDHYFHTADRILEMKSGRLEPYVFDVQEGEQLS